MVSKNFKRIFKFVFLGGMFLLPIASIPMLIHNTQQNKTNNTVHVDKKPVLMDGETINPDDPINWPAPNLRDYINVPADINGIKILCDINFVGLDGNALTDPKEIFAFKEYNTLENVKVYEIDNGKACAKITINSIDPKSSNTTDTFRLWDNLDNVNIYTWDKHNKISLHNQNSKVVAIKNGAFKGDNTIKEVDLSMVTNCHIGDYAFADMPKLERIKLANHGLTFGEYPFANCNKLNFLSMTNNAGSVLNLDLYTTTNTGIFRKYEFTGESEVIFNLAEKNPTYIGVVVVVVPPTPPEESIRKLAGTTNEIIGKGIGIAFGEMDFSKCGSIELDGTFTHSNLRKITLSEKIKISNDALLTPALSDIKYSNIPTGYLFLDGFGRILSKPEIITNGLIVDGVAFQNNKIIVKNHIAIGDIDLSLLHNNFTIGNKAFEGCKRLHSIKFSEHIEEIEALAFANCPVLDGIYFLSERPPKIALRAFANTLNGCLDEDLITASIYVPYGCRNLWQNEFNLTYIESDDYNREIYNKYIYKVHEYHYFAPKPPALPSFNLLNLIWIVPLAIGVCGGIGYFFWWYFGKHRTAKKRAAGHVVNRM